MFIIIFLIIFWGGLGLTIASGLGVIALPFVPVLVIWLVLMALLIIGLILAIKLAQVVEAEIERACQETHDQLVDECSSRNALMFDEYDL